MNTAKRKTAFSLLLIVSTILLITCLTSCEDNVNSNLLEIGISSDNLDNQYYEDIKQILIQQGFTNIVTRPEDRGLLFWKTPNTVKRITVNGEDSFTGTSKFPKDALIVIIYYTTGETNNGNN
jgi:hypothetical protein